MYRQTICLLCILLFSLEKADAYCDLPYKGVNCEQCLCYSINQTCSIYGENICRLSSNTTSSASSTPVWIFFVGPLVILGGICLSTGGYVFCCAFALYCCGALFLMIKSLATSFVEIVVSFFKCKCCHSTPAISLTIQSLPQNNSTMPDKRHTQIVNKKIKQTSSVTATTKIEDNYPSCVICLSSLKNGLTVKTIYCGHTFHKECIDQWFNERTPNPICPYRCIRETNDE